MVQASDFGNGDNVTGIGGLNRPRFGWIFPEGEMRARPIVIGRVAANDPQQVSAIECDHVIEALAA